MKIYGEDISGGTKPYVTLLVSIRDRADRILKEALEKYGIDYQRSGDEYYLAEIRSPLVDDDDDGGEDDLEHRPGQPQTERALDDDDCPLLIYAHDANKGKSFALSESSVDDDVTLFQPISPSMSVGRHQLSLERWRSGESRKLHCRMQYLWINSNNRFEHRALSS